MQLLFQMEFSCFRWSGSLRVSKWEISMYMYVSASNLFLGFFYCCLLHHNFITVHDGCVFLLRY